MQLKSTLLCLLLMSCGGGPDLAPPQAAHVQRPDGGREVSTTTSLQQQIEDAAEGSVLWLSPGEHRGPVTISKSLVLWGPPEAVIKASEGSAVRVRADHVSLLGFTIVGGGQRFDLMDGGAYLRGNDLRIEGVTVRESLFGILVEASERAIVRGNVIEGTGIPAMGLRGDGIRLWETNDSEVVGNVVTDARDLVVWYSSRNRVTHNTVLRCRYGTHFMFSHENVVEDNSFVDTEVGVFVMYSRDIVLRRNLIARASGAAGIGIGLKDAGNITITDNWLLANTVGLYVDTSPIDPDHHNDYQRNVIQFSEVAASLHASVQRTRFIDNTFKSNGAVVRVGGQGDAMACEFLGNHYDTYQGYDFDGDGHGDVPFEFRRLSTQIQGKYPELALLHGAPAMAIVDLVGEVLPLYTPRRLMRDPSPRMRPIQMSWMPEVRHAR